MEFTHRLVIGDWSNDGHEKSDFVAFNATHSREDIIKAYNEAVKKVGVTVCGDYTESPMCLCQDYEDSSIPDAALEKLEEFGISKEEMLETNYFDEFRGNVSASAPESLAWLFLEMVQKLLPEFDYEFISFDDLGCINGFWQKDFNKSIGYGLYY